MKFKHALPLLLAATLPFTGMNVASAENPSNQSSTLGPDFPPVSPSALSSAAGNTPATVAGDSHLLFDPADPFYLPPEEFPSEPGSLIRAQNTPHLLNIVGPDLPGSAQKILYTSTTTHGDPVAVSGYVIEPARQWQGEGPTPTVVFAPGTRGAGDSCAPSRTSGLLSSFDLANPTANSNYELPYQYAASLYGMRVVVTDYIGLGTPGVHTYVNNTEEAHAVLDAARAGLQAAGAPADSPVGFWGYSQGGGATASAAEHAATYAPELAVKGTYAGAPPANLETVMNAVDGSSITAVLGYAINGYVDRFPEFKTALDTELNDKGRDFLQQTSTGCITDSIVRWAMADTGKFTNSGEKISTVASRIPLIKEVFAEENLGHLALNAPMMLGSSPSDDIIPNDQVLDLGRKHCEKGGEVYYNRVNNPSLTSSQPYSVDHFAGMITDTPASLNYLVDRFNDVPAPNNCGTF